MSDKGKKRAAEWCTFCDMGGHTRDECRVWAACVRDIGLANIAAMTAAYKPPPPPPPHTIETCTNNVYLDKKPAAAHHDASLLAIPPTTSAEGSGSAASTSSVSANFSVAPQGNPGVDSDLLSIFGQVSRSEAMLMLQFLDRTRNEGTGCEGLVEKLAIQDKPGQSKTAQGPHKE
ncbi:hypothetical protein N7465_003976 [Penicillium sp. CMV-2018d]|nr:hypothetical protein N7465_003976 [Penicillium sp. CMV-2018d]